jgi:hypothetical protein
VSIAASLTQATPPSKSLATITGTVTDNKGNPLSGALVSLLREGAKQVKEARTDDKGNFIAKVLPGRYGIRAIATGFSEVVFSSVEVKASQELIKTTSSGCCVQVKRVDRFSRLTMSMIRRSQRLTRQRLPRTAAMIRRWRPRQSAPLLPKIQKSDLTVL